MKDSLCRKMLEGLLMAAFVAWFLFMGYAFISILKYSFPPLVFAGLLVMWWSASALAFVIFILALFKLDGID